MFTENQVRQFYVGTSTANDVIAPVEVDSSHAATDLSAKSDGACQFVLGPNKDEFYLMYKGPGGVVRSDLIKKCNIIDVRCTSSKDLKHKKKLVELAVASDLLSSSNLAVTADYVVNVDIHGYVSPDYNSTKLKFGAARGVSGTSASDLYKKLAISLAKNFAREAAPLVKIMVKISSSYVEVLPSYTTSTSAISGTATCIAIEEVEQPWRRGAAPQEFVNFTVEPSTIYNSGVDVVWGTVTDKTATNTNAIVNSKKVADMEWFFHKERGDRYAEQCWPWSIDTEYQVDPSNAYGYGFIDIHYYFEGNCHNVGHSEKTLTIVFPGKSSDPDANAQKLIGAAATTGQSATAATGLYAWLEGTGVDIKFSANWDA